MPKYSILVVDDQPGETEQLFKNLFDNDERFECTQVKTYSEFKKENIASHAAVLLDINLGAWGPLSDALSHIGNKSPVVLVSRYWDKDRTHHRISDALAEAKEVKLIATMMLNNLVGDHWQEFAESMRFQLSDAIDRERGKAQLDLKEDEPVRILHLSDPQYGDTNSDDWATYVETEIAQFIQDKLDLEIHFIAITGDISFSGAIDQYEKAEKKLTKLIQRFIPNKADWKERILLVPGNHDVNLRLAAADKIKINEDLSIEMDVASPKNYSYRQFALAPFRDFASRLTGDPHWRDADELNWINDSFNHIKLRFFLLNSAATIDCDHPQKAGFLHDDIEELGGEDGQPFGIAFSHHGPPEAGNTEPDSLSDWPQTVPFLKTRGIRLFIHGHGHERKVDRFHLANQTTRAANGQLDNGEILRIMAPTTHLNGKLRPKNEVRGFNLITLQRKHGKVQSVKVESYDASKGELEQSEGSPWECRV